MSFRTVARTTPYAWPFDGDLSASGTAVVWAATFGREPEAQWRTHAELVAAAIKGAGGVVIHVITTPPPRLGLPQPDPVGLSWSDLDLVAPGVDGFSGTWLDGELRRRSVSRIVLVGSGLESSIHSTMRSANDRGYECLLVTDACEPHDPDLAAAAWSQIEMSGGIFGAIGKTADVVTAYTS
jgi:nicotinamidase-related amidase